MVLTEISPNVRPLARTSGSIRSALQDGQPSTKEKMPTPRAVRSMLKTTTELGDLGEFSVRPPRVPRSGSRIQSTRPRSGSFDSSLASALRHRRSPPRRPHRHHGPRPTPSLPAMSSHSTTRSNLTSYHHNPRSRKRGGHHRYGRGLEGLNSPRPGMQALYSHRSLATLRSQRDFYRMHSYSPLSYQMGAARSEYRSSSPAYSEAQSSFYPQRSRFHRTTSAMTAASSPASLSLGSRAFSSYRPDLNGSFSSLVRLPSPAVPVVQYPPGRYGFPSRTNTPVSSSMLDPRVHSSASRHSTPGLPKSPTASSTPYYYDYTEPFEEENCFSPNVNDSRSSLPLNMDQTIMEHGPPPVFRQAQTPFGTRPGSTFSTLRAAY